MFQCAVGYDSLSCGDFLGRDDDDEYPDADDDDLCLGERAEDDAVVGPRAAQVVSGICTFLLPLLDMLLLVLDDVPFPVPPVVFVAAAVGDVYAMTAQSCKCFSPCSNNNGENRDLSELRFPGPCDDDGYNTRTASFILILWLLLLLTPEDGPPKMEEEVPVVPAVPVVVVN